MSHMLVWCAIAIAIDLVDEINGGEWMYKGRRMVESVTASHILGVLNVGSYKSLKPAIVIR